MTAPLSLVAPAQRCFRVMGCAAQVMITGGGSEQLDRAESRLRELEGRWSRFLATSDITRANVAAGEPVSVHADTVAVVARAIEAWRQTRGRFDITVLPALVHHGYTHSASGGPQAPRVSERMIGVSGDVAVDSERCTITVPGGAAIDLGGIGKGFAADVVVAELLSGGATGALVNIGGDIAAAGVGPGPEGGWQVGVEDPTDAPALITTIQFARGGVATSGTTIRRWTTAGGETAHHLIDPVTARPAATSLLTASIIAADAATAEAFATAAMMSGAADAMALLEGAGLAGLLVAHDGVRHRTESWLEFEP